jgi:hypothetical protein
MIHPVTSRGVCVAGGAARWETSRPCATLHQSAYGSFGATVSAGAEFLGEPGCVGAAFFPALGEVVEMGVELATPPGDLGEQFLGGKRR